MTKSELTPVAATRAEDVPLSSGEAFLLMRLAKDLAHDKPFTAELLRIVADKILIVVAQREAEGS